MGEELVDEYEGRVVESWDGFKWYVETDDDRLPLGEGEECIMRFLLKVADPSKIFLDVGAHVGEYTVRMSKRCGEVIAIEPNPRTIRILRRNIRLNDCDNIIIHQCAAADYDGVMCLYERGGSSTLLDIDTRRKGYEVPLKRLDDIVDEADIVKIDVEGYEERVVKGMMRIVKQCRPFIVIEHHEFRGYDIAGMRERIYGLLDDYHHLDVNGVHTIYIPKEYDLAGFPEVVAWAWIQRIINNITSGKPWYFGLPHTWWYGAGIPDFIEALPRHILKEREWIELLGEKA